MIPLSNAKLHNKSWQKQLAVAKPDYQSVLKYLQLKPSQVAWSSFAGQQFPLKVTADYLACIEKGNPDDPLLRQILPVSDELADTAGYSEDPVGDLAATGVPGLIHKYPDRVLLITTPACAIHCRYCFRRHFPYSDNSAHSEKQDGALAYISADSKIKEVILSGGDPLSLSDSRLARLVEKIAAIKHIETLRIHSRLPVILPDRLTPELADLLTSTRLQTVMVTHTNHPAELSDKVAGRLQQFRPDGLTLLNQAVLLKGVNDCEKTQVALSRKLFSFGILPYYLHMLDQVKGAGHFHVSLQKAIDIHRGMRSALPGYLVPRLIKDKAETPFKENAY